jgi:hypothetical protein
VLDSPHTGAGEGVPFVFDRYLLVGELTRTFDELDAGESAALPSGGELRVNDLPVNASIVVF